MTLPSPDDLAQAPAWENYIVAQCVQAMLGAIPRNALAIAATIERADVGLHFQMASVTEEDREDISEIESGLLSLVGSAVNVTVTTEVLDRRDSSRFNKVRWLYLRHV
ncbi:hypothetical protein ACGGZK_06790 [Agromyces sp. MMS24-K17]|uniref:hypothetical protein n=1 Tax=Agromyces sp. MMS24-K17 TaxID=3372850 RepID=UPI00375483E8